MSDSLPIKITAPRQRRALKALLRQSEGISCKDLGPLIGALNPRQSIMQLWRLGFKDAIVTESFIVLDQDGKSCRPGRYRILPEHREWVQRVLNENVKGSGTTELMTDDFDVDLDDSTRGLPCQ